MGDVHHCSRAPVSEMTYTVSSGMLNSTILYHTGEMPFCLPSSGMKALKTLETGLLRGWRAR